MIREPSQISSLTDRTETAEDRELAAVLDRYLISLEEGEPLQVEALAAAHPHLAADIRAFATSLDTLHRAAHGAAASLPVETATTGDVTSRTRRLGDFEIGRELGRGGMGVVYEARQLSLQRTVALKVLPFAAVWDQKQLARFQNEAQAAAQLHHPHIVPVFAVGQDRGVHFYAMQYIDGCSLDQIILERRGAHERRGSAAPDPQAETLSEANSLTQSTSPLSSPHTQRSEYFAAVARLGIEAAEALDYAHEYGVVHRDVKPSNLLLDNAGRLWITDFGLARVRNNPGVTLTGDVVGTIRYMSPEQAAGRQALVDPRTDVYSLGASLYELLTLRAAFPGDDRQAVMRAVAELEPTPPRTLDPAIPLDLETIVLHALAKSRDNRYATAADLAADLRRFLDGKPTRARRPNVLDLAFKWVRRHRTVVAVAASLLLLLSIVSTAGVLLLTREHANKEAALATAQRNLEQARLVVDRFGSQFERNLAALPGSEPLRQALLTDTLGYYRDFIAQAQHDATLRADLASTYAQAAGIASRLGQTDEAIESLRAGADLYGELAAESPDSKPFRLKQATCLNNLGLIEVNQGQVTEAEGHFRRAVELASAYPDSREAVGLWADVLTNQGLLERQQDHLPQAEALLAQSIALLRKQLTHSPDDAELRRALAIALNNRSFVEQVVDWSAARESSEEAVALLTRLCDTADTSAGNSIGLRSDLALCLNNLGAIFGHQQQHAEAAAAYRRAIEVQEQLVRQAPAVVELRSDLAITWNNLGQSLSALGDSEAVAAYETARRRLAELVADVPNDLRYRSSLAGVLNNQALGLEQTGQLSAALKHYRQAIELQREVFDKAPQQAQFRDLLSKHYANYGRALRAAGSAELAAEVALDRRELWPNDPKSLVGIALELARAADLLSPGEQREGIIDAAAETLRQAAAVGFELPDSLEELSDFDTLNCSDELAARVAQDPT